MSKKEDEENLKLDEEKSEVKPKEESIDKNTKKSRIRYIIIICISIIISILIFIGITVMRYEDVVYPKSYLYNINVSKLDNQELHETINSLEDKFLSSKINIKSNFNNFEIDTNKIILSLNGKELEDKIMNYGKNNKTIQNIKSIIFSDTKNYRFDIDFNEEALTKQIEDISTVVNVNYENAKIDINGDKINIKKEGNGVKLDAEKLKKSIYKQINTFDDNKNILTVDIDFKIESPKIKTNDLKLVDTKISEFYTNYSGSIGRRLNVENAANKIDDTILMPGEEFSYEKVVGPVTYDNGYKDAPVIVNGESSVGIGGGVCQVSSTMYNAQLKAGILPTERRNHSKAVAYVPRGLDATLASGIIDYKFKNPYEYPVVINTYTEDSKLYIEFWSNKEVNKNITYEPISFVSGKSAQSYLYGYDKDGKKVYEKFIDTSVYK